MDTIQSDNLSKKLTEHLQAFNMFFYLNFDKNYNNY